MPVWTSDDARPDYVPETSWLDEDGRIRDKIDYPFVDDPAVLGVWTSVDFVEDVDDFDPAQPRWQGELYLQKLDFLANGGTQVQVAGDSELRPGPWKWTNNLVMHGGDHTAAEYLIESIDGVDYLFLEWKSGDYTIRHMKPGYYVLRRAD
jgi:bla regulator protein BlaR1